MVIYTFFIWCLSLFFKIGSRFNQKIKEGYIGRKNCKQDLIDGLKNEMKVIWVHVASHGEFDQALPIVRLFQENFQDFKILITFFSPSGYHFAKPKYPEYFIAFLPFDLPSEVRAFLDLVNPKIAIFTKKEIWPNYIFELKKRQTPLFLISALFRASDFRLLNLSFYRKAIFAFDHIFLQNESSKLILMKYGINQSSVEGDTRIDRVLERKKSLELSPIWPSFGAKVPMLVLGSSWEAEENIVSEWMLKYKRSRDISLIIAPHDIGEKRIKQITELFPTASRYSEGNKFNSNIVVLDTIGKLAEMYAHASIALVGGGFGNKGIHNLLEPACFGIPVVFGPNIKKNPETSEFIENGFGFIIRNADDLEHYFVKYVFTHENKDKLKQKAFQYFAMNEGAAARIFNQLNIYL